MSIRIIIEAIASILDMPVSILSLPLIHSLNIAERNSRTFYSDFILNFGDNKTYIGVNVEARIINPLPVTPAAPLEVTIRRPIIVMISPTLRCTL